ncbi:MAG: hypothetical protein KMY55_14680 [Dethiosulfatibacter sp.]|nr:hypothetical protein [Dethiosulfatibacter sp.]
MKNNNEEIIRVKIEEVGSGNNYMTNAVNTTSTSIARMNQSVKDLNGNVDKLNLTLEAMTKSNNRSSSIMAGLTGALVLFAGVQIFLTFFI